MNEPNIPRAADIMTRDVLTLRPDMSVIEAERLFVKHRISGAPVVDSSGKIVGVLSEFDCLRILASGQFAESNEEEERVGDAMSCDLECIEPDLDLFAIAHRFLGQRVRRLPVLEDGRLVGLVSRRDVLRGVESLRRQLRAAPKGQRPKGLYLSASDPDGTEISKLLE